MRIRTIVSMTLLSCSVWACGSSEPEAPPRPSATVVAVNQAVDTQYFDATTTLAVEEVALNFFPAEGEVLRDPAEDGGQFIRVALAVTNTGEKEFSVNFTNYTLTLPDGSRKDMTLLINKGNASDQLESTTLQTGESTKGALYFEAPAAATADQLALAYKGYVDGDEQYFEVPFGQ